MSWTSYMTGETVPPSVIVSTALYTPIKQASNGEKLVFISHPSSKHPLPKLSESNLLLYKLFSLSLCITFIQCIRQESMG
jgi:hypothetical protein